MQSGKREANEATTCSLYGNEAEAVGAIPCCFYFATPRGGDNDIRHKNARKQRAVLSDVPLSIATSSKLQLTVLV